VLLDWDGHEVRSGERYLWRFYQMIALIHEVLRRAIGVSSLQSLCQPGHGRLDDRNSEYGHAKILLDQQLVILIFELDVVI
jgi:hypothetical protein